MNQAAIDPVADPKGFIAHLVARSRAAQQAIEHYTQRKSVFVQLGDVETPFT